MVMCPIQMSTTETQPTVSWVTLRTKQESTKAQRTARSEPSTEAAPREARTCNSTASTVWVPNSQANRVCGASVRSTSHSGTTTFRSTWLEDSTPLQTDRMKNPRFLNAPGETCTSGPTGTSTVRR
ncbi:MAG: hypothetical protein JWN68_2278 [Nocardioides sp.]|jgi:hypothetical protein|nr:hypothetical protein [Nocardioides sp.]